ncbi:hypothetical protein Q5P01_020535, partial [Channa striata]
IEVLEQLAPQQKAELILDPQSGALDDKAIVKEVFTSLTESAGIKQLSQFFQAFTVITKQENITFIPNTAVRDTILNVTLQAIAPEYETFGPEDFKLWFQVYLATVMASLRPDSLVGIPSNITCASYESILQLKPTLSGGNSSQDLCNFTVTQYACSSATYLTPNSLASLLKCSLESRVTYPVEVWKLLFQKASTVLDEALVSFASMAPNNSNPSLSEALEALGEVKIANFSQSQLQTDAIVSSWFQKTMRPFLASASDNFLFCLSVKNFSCRTYQTVIQAFSRQRPYMDNKTQHAVFTYFAKPFLSRNDSSDPGCVSSITDSKEWLQANFGDFSAFATVPELQALNPNFSSIQSLSALSPAQVAQLTLSLGASMTPTYSIVCLTVWKRQCCGKCGRIPDTADNKGEVPDFQPAVRDLLMNRTFTVISPTFPRLDQAEWIVWFHVKLVPLLPSFTPVMLKDTISNISCTNYHVVVSGLAKVVSAIPLQTRQRITDVLLGYLKKSASVINEPACRQQNESDAKWLEGNLDAFSQYATYSDLKVFNLSAVAVVHALSPQQKAELILDPQSGALDDKAIVKEVFTSLTESAGIKQLSQFFQAFTVITKQENITFIPNTAVRDTILNVTLQAIAPEYETFGPEDFKLWFQVYLATVMASLRPDSSLVGIPSNITCASYESIKAFNHRCDDNCIDAIPLSHFSSQTGCSVPDSFVCKETQVDENLICAAADRLQLKPTLSGGNSSQDLCNFTVTQYACSSATYLTPNSLASLLKCSLESRMTYPVEVWKLLFQKASTVLDEALVSFASMAPNNSNPSLSEALEALGEVKIANFSQSQLQTDAIVSSWFQKTMRPFLASASDNFLFCLSVKNFSCRTYQTVIQAFSSQRPYMDNKTQHAVFTYFAKPFLSRNDSSDPGCVSSITDSKEWLQANFGDFSAFATVPELQALNPNFSSVPDFQPAVRDLLMNRTFTVISPTFPRLDQAEWIVWFHVKLVPLLPSFSPVMLKDTISNISCTNYHVVVSGLAKVVRAIPLQTRQRITDVLLGYLKKSASVINEPACRQQNESDAKWLEGNLDAFSQYATYSDLKVFNLSAVAVVHALSPQQKAELILDPQSGALDDKAIVKEVFTSLTESAGIKQLSQFFQAFTVITKQENITFIPNTAVRDTILNVTLQAIAPEYETFGPEDFKLWFQVYLATVMASLRPDSLVGIPSNITCASYESIKAFNHRCDDNCIDAIPLSHFSSQTGCSVPDSFVITTQTNPVRGNSSQDLCNFTVTQYACSSATYLTPNSLASLLKCSLESRVTYPVEVWKLLFQKASTVLDEALVSFASMAPNNSNPSLSEALEALGEVKIANFSQSQLQTDAIVSSWFQKTMRPFLASASDNFLFCLSVKNFSCRTHQTVIQAFSRQRPYMDNKTQHAVFTYFAKPFLSRNDSSDPGCVSSITDSKEWLQANFGDFSAFATVPELQALNPNFSSIQSLSALSPAQVAQLTLSLGALNDTDLFNRVPDFQPAVRDLLMNRTFTVISPTFPRLDQAEWIVWFHVKLVPLLPSFSPVMLKDTISNISCTNYHVVVSGLAKVVRAIPLQTRQRITDVLLGYLKKSASVINEPACRQQNESDAKWLEGNLDAFSQYATYSDLKVFNLSAVAVVHALSPQQKAELILDPQSGALDDKAIVKEVFTSLTESAGIKQLSQFFQAFTVITKQENITFIPNTAVRDTILNVTLQAIAPEYETFGPEDFKLWFQVYLATVMASLRPDSLVGIPSNITCASYESILAGLEQSLKSLPLDLSRGVRSSRESFKKTFPRCSVPDSFVCKETQVDENLICAAADRLQLKPTLSGGNSSQDLCNFTVTQYACSSATYLTPNSLASLLKCSLESRVTYPVEVWKLLFQKASTVLDEALVSFASMAPNNSNPSLSEALEALGEVKIANFSQSQLQTDAIVSSWFQKTMRPFFWPLHPTTSCSALASRTSAAARTRLIQAFSSQRPYMDNKTQHAVFTYFAKPFLSRNDSSDPGCVSSITDSKEWLQANFGDFSAFATVPELQALNPNFSSIQSLSALSPAQVAQLTLSLGALNDTDLFNRVPDFQPAVRDLLMNRTFTVISPTFPRLDQAEWIVWFHVKLVPLLPSFSPVMLKDTISNISCTNYHVVVSGLAKVVRAIPLQTRQRITDVLLGYLKKSASVINEPACRQQNESDAKWLEGNLDAFSQYATYSDLKVFNLSAVAVVHALSPQQKAELILDPQSGALDDKAIVKEVFTSLTESAGIKQLSQFFQAFTVITKQENITFIPNTAVRDTILNVTLQAIAPEYETFGPEDFKLWFQVYLATVMASLRPDSLVGIPSNITCASYESILAGLEQSLKSLPLDLSRGVRSSRESFKRHSHVHVTLLTNLFRKAFNHRCDDNCIDAIPLSHFSSQTGCSVPDSFVCKETQVDENLICAAADRLQLKPTLSGGNSSQDLCNFTVTQYACSSATYLTPNSLASLLKCSLESRVTYPVEVWKLLFQKASTVLDEALVSFASMVNASPSSMICCLPAPNNSNPSLSEALEALGEVKIANFSQSQLQTDAIVSSWFQKTMRPFLASASDNFLFCLSVKNFSCRTYQTVIQAFSSQRPYMDNKTQHAVFTYFAKPFLSRNDSSDPGCVSSITDSKEWLQANFGDFSAFATVPELQALNPNFSSIQSLSALSPAQVAQLTLSLGALNDTDLFNRVFDRLEKGNAVENVDEFLTQLTTKGEVPDFQPAVRDLLMNRTFTVISPIFPRLDQAEWIVWFHVKLVPLLPSFSPVMLKDTISNISCTNYHVVVSGLAKVVRAIPLQTRQRITDVLLGYLKKSASVINEPACRQQNESDAKWLEGNLDAFSQYATYSDLKVFNLSAVAVVHALSPQQKAELILDPQSGALDDKAIVKEVFTSLTESAGIKQLSQFFQAFTVITKQENITFIPNTAVRDTILNVTLQAIAPEYETFGPEDFKLWFQVYLATVMASLRPDSLVGIPSNITCASYESILAGLEQSLKSLPLDLSRGVRSSRESFKRHSHVHVTLLTNLFRKAFNHRCDDNCIDAIPLSHFSSQTGCSVPDSFVATYLTPNSLASLLKCSLESRVTYPAPNNSNPLLSEALEALGEVKIANFSQSQLQTDAIVSSWFQKTMRPFLASASDNFLFCLSVKNFSCRTYQTVIQAFSRQRPYMDNKTQHAVFTYFAKPFLSRNDSSDPGCVSSITDSKEWLQANFGDFSAFATVPELQALNPNFSSIQSLSALSPAQVAQLTLSLGASMTPTYSIVCLTVWKRQCCGKCGRIPDTADNKGRACRQQNESDAKWLEGNLDAFSQYATYSDLKVFNLSAVAVVHALSPQQKAELILDPQSGALDDKAIVKEVFTSLTESAGIKQLSQFFQAFTVITKQENITFIPNTAVRDTILNVTLQAIAPEYETFGPEDFKLWFQVYLATVMASLRPDSLVGIPSNITCASYESILAGLEQSLKSLPLDLSRGVRSSRESFKRHSHCKETQVDENLICAAADRWVI